MDGRRRRGEETRARILDAARARVAEVGAEFTLDELAEGLGVTKQAILHHFPSKERILVEIALALVGREDAAARSAIDGRGGADALEAFVRALVALYLADLESFRLVYLRAQLIRDLGRAFPVEERAERLYPVTGRMYAAVEAAAGPGSRERVVAAHFVAIGFATMYGTTVAPGDPMKRGFEAYLDAFLTSWRRGLAAG